MDYYDRIQNIIDYIEDHLYQDISLKDLAQKAYFSEFHFHRVFTFIVGETVREYIRKRRLSNAAYELSMTSRRVIDIALDHGFQTHETFTRAFRKYFNCTPASYRKTYAGMDDQPFRKVNLVKQVGGIVMEPKIVVKPEFKVAGYAVRTTMKNNQNQKDIGAFWQDYMKKDLYQTIPNKKVEDVEYGICTDFMPEEGDLTYIICTEVTSFDGIPDELECRTVPEAKYAVFTTPKAAEKDFSQAINKTWSYIFGEWFPASGYEHGGTPEFEYYDIRSHGSDNKQMDIYIPIVEKK